MISADQILKEEGPSGGSFSFTRNGDTAKTSFSRTTPTLVIASSTTVPDSMRGQGVGEALLAAFVADAKKNGYKIMPLCPFVKAKGPSNPDYASVFTA